MTFANMTSAQIDNGPTAIIQLAILSVQPENAMHNESAKDMVYAMIELLDHEIQDKINTKSCRPQFMGVKHMKFAIQCPKPIAMEILKKKDLPFNFEAGNEATYVLKIEDFDPNIMKIESVNFGDRKATIYYNLPTIVTTDQAKTAFATQLEKMGLVPAGQPWEPIDSESETKVGKWTSGFDWGEKFNTDMIVRTPTTIYINGQDCKFKINNKIADTLGIHAECNKYKKQVADDHNNNEWDRSRDPPPYLLISMICDGASKRTARSFNDVATQARAGFLARRAARKAKTGICKEQQ